MADTSGLSALGRSLDQYLIEQYSPPPGTQTALGFLPGIAVNPSSFAPTGVVNPLAVQTFLNSVVNVLGPVVDGRFAGFMSAHQIYGMVIDIATPVDAPGTPAAEAFLSVKGTARSAFGASPVKQLVSTPLNWYDPGSREGWSTFDSAVHGRSGEQETSSTGETPAEPVPGQTPPVIAPSERFEKLWRWRTLDQAAIADVVLPSSVTAVEVDPEPVVLRDHRVEVRQPVVRDHRGIDLSEVSVRDHRTALRSTGSSSAARLRLAPTEGRGRALRSTPAPQVVAAGAEPSPVRVLATAPRRQLLAALAQDQPPVALSEDLRVRSTALARLIEVETPAVVQEFDDDVETSSTRSVESHDLTLSLEYCFVQVSRDTWWNDAVLRMPRWYAPGCPAGAFSSGTSVGGLPLGVPIAMVITRDVSVTGHWSDADRTAAESHTSFGPWSTHDSQMTYDERAETATLTIPGMQVVAVVCALLPPLAPVDDPTLSPSAAAATSR